MIFSRIVDTEGRVTGLMDALTVEYMESTKPDPSQASLDAILNHVTRIRVLDDGECNGKALGKSVLLECTDDNSLGTLRSCLGIIEDPVSSGHCMCFGDLAIEFYGGDEIIAVIGLHHGRSIRWNAWRSDAELRDNTRLLEWLKDHGITMRY